MLPRNSPRPHPNRLDEFTAWYCADNGRPSSCQPSLLALHLGLSQLVQTYAWTWAMQRPRRGPTPATRWTLVASALRLRLGHSPSSDTDAAARERDRPLILGFTS